MTKIPLATFPHRTVPAEAQGQIFQKRRVTSVEDNGGSNHQFAAETPL